MTPGDPPPAMALEQGAGSATEIYSRIATGAMGCWFGASGPLKKDYIYHADADAPSRGGKAEIVQQRLRSLYDAVEAEVGGALGIEAGFNALDGD